MSLSSLQSFCRSLPLLFACLLICAGCASQKAGVKSPELPPRHWLDEAPGVPVEHKDKLDAVVPNLYDPAKRFSFEDCVYLTIQQSPLLVNSAVEIEIKRVALTSAAWQYLPEPRMVFSVSNNLTRRNMDHSDTPSDYGRPKLDVGFYADFPNPVETYFTHKVRKVMVNLAIATHRKAVGEAIYKIAQSYLKLQARRDIIAAQKSLLPLHKKLLDYWHQVENVEGRQGVALNLATQHQRELELTVEQSVMEEIMERTQLKMLAGVNPQQRLNVDSGQVHEILGNFNGRTLDWSQRWPATEDELLLRSQILLGDFEIMVAWAQYVPDMTISVNKNPPAGQYQPADGKEDFFLHLNFDFPLLDWGRRYRDVQTARMTKAKAFHELTHKRTEYSNQWLRAEQAVALAETRLKLAKTRLDTAELQYREARIAFEEGTTELPELNSRNEEMTQARIAHIEAELNCRLANLDWMYLAGLLQERFLGLPAKELL